VTGARTVLLALVAAVLALALGLALGAGPVVGRSDAARADRTDRLAARVARLDDRVAGLQARADAADRVAAALSGPLTTGRLTGHSVLLVRTPGATQADVHHARAALLGAGASLTGTLTLTPTYLDPAKASSPLEDLALRLVPPGVTFGPGATSIERVGTVLARSTVSQSPPDATDQDAAELIAGLHELGAVRLTGDPGRLAELAVVVTGSREKADGKDALVALLKALDAAGKGALLTGPGTTATALHWARSGDVGGASTVDSADSAGGSVATVLALAEQLAGKQGAYGVGAGATAVVPASVLTAAPPG
jgi:hypothetical protein